MFTSLLACDSAACVVFVMVPSAQRDAFIGTESVLRMLRFQFGRFSGIGTMKWPGRRQGKQIREKDLRLSMPNLSKLIRS